MQQEWITNPLTNRKIKVNGRQYKSLMRAGIIKTEEKKIIILDLNDKIQSEEFKITVTKPKYELIDLSKDQFEFVEKPKNNVLVNNN